MPTENPKISAYVPQVVYDRFKQFQEERGLSMSQATIELLVDYFGIDISKSSTEQSTGGLPDRVASLEKELADLKQSYVWLVQKVESIQSTSELPDELEDIGNSSLESELPRQLPLIESDEDLPSELLSEIKSSPLQGKLLANRLNISTSVLSSSKSSLPVERFYDWLEEKDPDRIRWVNLGEGRSKGYVPADDTPLEKLQSLKDWIQSQG